MQEIQIKPPPYVSQTIKVAANQKNSEVQIERRDILSEHHLLFSTVGATDKMGKDQYEPFYGLLQSVCLFFPKHGRRQCRDLKALELLLAVCHRIDWVSSQLSKNPATLSVLWAGRINQAGEETKQGTFLHWNACSTKSWIENKHSVHHSYSRGKTMTQSFILKRKKERENGGWNCASENFWVILLYRKWVEECYESIPRQFLVNTLFLPTALAKPCPV